MLLIGEVIGGFEDGPALQNKDSFLHVGRVCPQTRHLKPLIGEVIGGIEDNPAELDQHRLVSRTT